MRRASRLVAAAALCLGVSLPAVAAESQLDVVAGLRARRMYDQAIEHLEKLESDGDAPAEVKEQIPYEKATILLERAKTVRDPEQQAKQIDQADALLEQFLKATPNHTKAGQATSDRANLLLGKARVEVQRSRAPENAGTKSQSQSRAREHIEKARVILQAANDRHKAAHDKFPVFIDPTKDKEQAETRRVAENHYIKTQLELALATYEEAQTYDPATREHTAMLAAAADGFQAMHEKYRSQVGGLYARMWQGKCFEEMEDLGKAMGIYNELLSHPGESESLRGLQDQVAQFRLTCLNHDQRKDYQLVVQEATEWLARPNARTSTQVGLGIRYERAKAEAAMGLNPDVPEAKRVQHLRRALADAKEVNRFAGPYKDATTIMIRRIGVALGGE